VRERELKLVVDDDFVLPALDGVVHDAVLGPATRRSIEDSYFDTADFRLARWGVTLRSRAGAGWTVKIPNRSGSVSVLDREEIEIEGIEGDPPRAALGLVVSFARESQLIEVARIVNDRTSRVWCRGNGTAVAELVDDRVAATTPDGEVRFREIEVELAGDTKQAVLRDVLRVLGVESPGKAVPKLVKVLGARASAPPDVVVPVLGANPTAAEVMGSAIAASVTRLLCQVPAARLGTDPEGVHQARVATRRLRSDLLTFAPLIDRKWGSGLRCELSWLAGELGKVRDGDVLHGKLQAVLARNAEIDTDAAATVLSVLGRQRDCDREALLEHLCDTRAIRLFEQLVDAASTPRTLPRAERRARKVMPGLVDKSWRRLRRAVKSLPDDPSIAQLHEVRILAKRVRYASEAVMPAAGKKASKFAAGAASIQDSLGVLNDAAVAEAWLATAASGLDGPAAFAAGRLAQQVTAEARVDRREWSAAFEKMCRHSPWLTRQ